MLKKNKIYAMPMINNPNKDYWQISEKDFNLDIMYTILFPIYKFINNEPVKAFSYLLEYPNIWVQFGNCWSYKLIKE